MRLAIASRWASGESTARSTRANTATTTVYPEPSRVMDANRNCTQVAFDALGMAVGTAVMGKPTDNPRPGDRLDSSFQPDAPESLIEAFVSGRAKHPPIRTRASPPRPRTTSLPTPQRESCMT